MRFRDSARWAAPVCYVQAAAARYDDENRVKKSFTYVRKQDGAEYALRANLKAAVKDLTEILRLLDAHDAAKTKRDRRRIRGDLRDLFYSAKAETFDAEEQMLEATKLS